MLAEVRKLGHLGLKTIPKRSTLPDANSRRSEKFFEDVYRDLYEANKETLSSDSRRNGTEAWIKRLRIIITHKKVRNTFNCIADFFNIRLNTIITPFISPNT